MNAKKPILVLVFALAAFVFSKLAQYYVESTTPNVVNDIVNSRESNQKLELILGGYLGFESTYNEHNLQKDTLAFKVRFFGKKKNILINALAKKQAESKWQLIRTDTTYFTK
jgi:hypothetical protein